MGIGGGRKTFVGLGDDALDPVEHPRQQGGAIRRALVGSLSRICRMRAPSLRTLRGDSQASLWRVAVLLRWDLTCATDRVDPSWRATYSHRYPATVPYPTIRITFHRLSSYFIGTGSAIVLV